MNTEALHKKGQRLTTQVRDIERREWWLWTFAVTLTIALAIGIVALSFPEYQAGLKASFWSDLRERVRGLAALVLLFDIYTVFQHFQLQRLRKQFAEKSELFELITENADDMIAVVDRSGKRLYNSPSYSSDSWIFPGHLAISVTFRADSSRRQTQNDTGNRENMDDGPS
jgi:PAS domain-containing protein